MRVCWRSVATADLLFAPSAEAVAILLAAMGLAFAVLIWRIAIGRALGRNLVALPALLGVRSPFPAIRHAPMLLVIAGLPVVRRGAGRSTARRCQGA